jgi:hypothetical protein
MYGKKSKLAPNVDGAIAKLDFSCAGVNCCHGNVRDVELEEWVCFVGAGGGAVR